MPKNKSKNIQNSNNRNKQKKKQKLKIKTPTFQLYIQWVCFQTVIQYPQRFTSTEIVIHNFHWTKIIALNEYYAGTQRAQNQYTHLVKALEKWDTPDYISKYEVTSRFGSCSKFSENEIHWLQW